MKNEIIKYIITTLIGAVIAGLISYIKTLRNKVKANIQKDKEEEEAIKLAIKMLLRAEIKSNCKYYIEKGTMTENEYEELCEAMNVYENGFNGNGLTHKLFEAVQENVEIE